MSNSIKKNNVVESNDNKPNPYVRTFDEKGWQDTMTQATGLDEQKRKNMMDEVMDKHKATQGKKYKKFGG